MAAADDPTLPPAVSDFDRITADLQSRWPENLVEPSLTRDRALMDILGDPQASAPVVHLAGTNGKTSTTRMVDALLRATGLRTGMYTSPHLHSLTERISIDGTPISPEQFVEVYRQIEPFLAMVDGAHGDMTWFQVITGCAFACFADAPVDAMVIETGLGGRWDSTNVVDPAVCAITPIGMDHRQYLGDTLTDIAGEKAGIITAPVPVVVSRQAEEAMAVLAARCSEEGAELLVEGGDFDVIGRDVAVGGQMLDLVGVSGHHYSEVYVPLHGRHQGANAALALAAVESLLGGRALSDEVVREGFADVVSPGRLEVLRSAPTVLADAAHNPHGIAALGQALAESFAFDRVIAVVAVLADKDVDDMLAGLSDVCDHIVVTRNSSPRSLSADDLAAVAEGYWASEQIDVAGDVAEALEIAVARADEALPATAGVVVTGSVVTVADARALLSRR
jgi:dihydrofolate synthase/folylpolyglutamate synthase